MANRGFNAHGGPVAVGQTMALVASLPSLLGKRPNEDVARTEWTRKGEVVQVRMRDACKGSLLNAGICMADNKDWHSACMGDVGTLAQCYKKNFPASDE